MVYPSANSDTKVVNICEDRFASLARFTRKSECHFCVLEQEIVFNFHCKPCLFHDKGGDKKKVQ